MAGSAPSAVSSPRSSFDAHSVASVARPGPGSGARPEDMWEILCNDVPLPLDMTLAAVRQYIWKQAAELTMHYRRRRLVRGESNGSGSPREREGGSPLVEREGAGAGGPRKASA
jgi:WD repeat-containing protein 48